MGDCPLEPFRTSIDDPSLLHFPTDAMLAEHVIQSSLVIRRLTSVPILASDAGIEPLSEVVDPKSWRLVEQLVNFPLDIRR